MSKDSAKKAHAGRNPRVRLRLFFEVPETIFGALFLLEFYHDEENDWYEVRVFHGAELHSHAHGYANHGWNPQVNNIWVAERVRRRGLGSMVLSKIESYFGQIPLPGTPISDNEAARAFWAKFMSQERLCLPSRVT